MSLKCARCGLQSSIQVNHTAVCSKCGTSFPLCEKCTYSWKNQNCPNCGASQYNANWKIN
ncbi:MAG: hypothetical protein ACQERB_12485 [Promethearchaeati archaeon]